MKQYQSLLVAVMLILSACASETSKEPVLNRIASEIDRGNLSAAKCIADSLKSELDADDPMFFTADSLKEIAQRIALDYNLDKSRFLERLYAIEGSQIIADDVIRWKEKGWIECRIIEGDTMYFNRAPSNLIRLRKFREENETWKLQQENDETNRFYRNHITRIIADSAAGADPRQPVKMKVTYTVTVFRDAVPADERIRCWLPWPRSEEPRQKEAELLSASQDNYIKSPDSAIHSTIYMERKAVKGKPTVFTIEYTYTSSATHLRQGYFGEKPYDRNSAIYRIYTAEQLPQIHFSTKIKNKAEEIVAGEKNPAEVVRKIYLWFKENVPWNGAMEYSTMKDIPGYTFSRLTGDCGMQTLLLMSMLRSQGIPVRWQSGWMVAPGAENMHDWCEVYYEDAGWVPCDISFSMPISENKEIREFYLSGVDSYRMIINKGIAGKLYPEKKFLRSEPYDFQRGEVEWKEGNLYFDKWNYDIKIEYFK